MTSRYRSLVNLGASALLVTSFGACAITTASAQVLNFNSAISVSARTDGPYTIGTLLQVGGTSLDATALGVQDVGLNGLNAATKVGIWNATGTTLLDSVTVTNADPLDGFYRYVNLGTPLLLSANTKYLIGALVGGSLEPFDDSLSSGHAAYTASSDFSIVENTFHSGATLAAPTSNGTAVLGRWGAANVLVTAVVPEPASLALLAIAGVPGLLLIARRRAKR